MTDEPIATAIREAIAIYRAGLDGCREAAELAYAAGRLLELAGRPEQALDEYLVALLEPSAKARLPLLDAAIRCAKACNAEKRIARRLHEAASATAAMPEAGIVAGHLFRHAGSQGEAVAVLRNCLPAITDPDSRYWATRELVAAEAALGQVDRAAAVVRRAIGEHPEREAELRCDLAGLLAASGRFDDALAESQKAVSLASDLALAHYVAGASLLRLGRRSEADDAFERATSLDASLGAWIEALRGPIR